MAGVKTLGQLIPDLEEAIASIQVSGITQDSREVRPGDLFCARAGGSFKGADFVADAVTAGAVAVLIDKNEGAVETTVPVVQIDNLGMQLSAVAGRFFDEPSRTLKVVGVTGTNGKSSCAHFIAQMLQQLGMPAAIVGTLGNGFPGQLKPASHTTPDAIGLQRLLAEFVAEGAQAAVMEVSSHALDQGRVEAIQFDVAAFTNLSRDHLDYHGDMARYGAAKARLFKALNPAASVICCDDDFGQSLATEIEDEEHGQALLRVSMKDTDAEVCGVGLQLGHEGINGPVRIEGTEAEIQTRIIGDFNKANLLLSAAVVSALGFGTASVIQQLNRVQPVPGRMQNLGGGERPLVLVDYAHTPDALEKALESARLHSTQRLLCVFGCGGDRDTGKRAQMGQVASQLADTVIVTSDNPRTEDPAQIIEMVLTGCDQSKVEPCEDRAQAISRAVLAAKPGDVVLVAGKGHETYQEINGQRMPFDDVEVVQNALEEWQA